MSTPAETRPASALIDARIEELPAWQGKVLARVRRLVKQAVPGVVEEWKWRGVPVWSHDGIICTGETYKHSVKLTFAKGASLDDPARLFNASLDGNVRRAIDIHEGDPLDERAFKALVRAAANRNESARRKPAAAQSTPSTRKAAPRKTGSASAAKRKAPAKTTKPSLLSGGNPQIPMGYGNEPVQAYIEALPGWKREVGRRIDTIVDANLPGARKAVKWNSPFYGIPGQGWLVNVHAFTRYVKVSFFAGASLRPAPPGGTRDDARWIDIHEDDLDEDQLARWVKQSAKRSGWMTSDIRAEDGTTTGDR
ncbi:MAG: hypothetical protein AMXMBFR46_00290 [Acidimicrobiia bacterium]